MKSTVFDFTCAHTRQANRNAVHSSAVGARFVTTHTASHGHASRVSDTTSRACTSRPPSTERSSRAAAGVDGSRKPAVSAITTRMFVFAASTGRASSSTPGAITASMNVAVSAVAVATSIARLSPTMPPKADNASASRARS